MAEHRGSRAVMEARIDELDAINRTRSLTDAESDELCTLFERLRSRGWYQSRKLAA